MRQIRKFSLILFVVSFGCESVSIESSGQKIIPAGQSVESFVRILQDDLESIKTGIENITDFLNDQYRCSSYSSDTTTTRVRDTLRSRVRQTKLLFTNVREEISTTIKPEDRFKNDLKTGHWGRSPTKTELFSRSLDRKVKSYTRSLDSLAPLNAEDIENFCKESCWGYKKKWPDMANRITRASHALYQCRDILLGAKDEPGYLDPEEDQVKRAKHYMNKTIEILTTKCGWPEPNSAQCTARRE